MTEEQVTATENENTTEEVKEDITPTDSLQDTQEAPIEPQTTTEAPEQPDAPQETPPATEEPRENATAEETEEGNGDEVVEGEGFEDQGPAFKPKILAFLCNWCSYAGADLAGVSRYQYPTTVRTIRTMCSGRLDPYFVLQAFDSGSDGVLITGCHIGDCHYISGNYFTLRKVKVIKKLLEIIGLEPGRFMLEWVAAAEGQRFADLIKGFHDTLTQLGPVDLDNNPRIKKRLGLVKAETFSQRLRWIVGIERILEEEENVYGDKIPEEEFEKILDEIVFEEYVRTGILMLTKEEPKTVEEISEYLEVEKNIVFNNIARLWKMQIVLPQGHEGVSPKYINVGGD